MSNSFLLFSAIITFVLMLAPAPVAMTQGTPSAFAAASASSHVKPTPKSLARAKQIYGIDCAMCHGENGNGKTGLATSMKLTLPDFTNPQSLAGKSDADLFHDIRKGKGKMPPEGAGRANNKALWNLIIYIHSMSNASKTHAAAPAAK